MRILFYLLLSASAACSSQTKRVDHYVSCGVSPLTQRTEQGVKCVISETPAFLRDLVRAYQYARRSDWLTEGNVVVVLNVAPNGRARATLERNDINSHEFAIEVIRIFEEIDYGISGGDAVVVNYPFEMRPN